MLNDDIRAAYTDNNFDRALALSSQRLADHGGIDLLHIAGLCKIHLHEQESGVALLKAAISFRPNAAYIYVNSGLAMERLGLADELDYFVTRGLRDFPDDRALHHQQANVYLLRRNYAVAIAAYEALVEADPTDVRAYINLGNTYRLLDDIDKAEQYFGLAYKIDPDNRALRINLASMYSERNNLSSAMSFLDGIEDDPDAVFMMALFSLATGDFERGWAMHRQRWQSRLFAHATIPPRPLHDLSEADGKPIAVLREGGYGDVLQFMRYLPMLAERTSELLFHPLPNEYRLLRANLPATITLDVVPNVRSMILPDRYERSVPLLDLPYFYHTTLDTIPAALPYLHVPAENVDQHRLPPTHKKRVGLVWAGGPMTGVNERPYDAHRSIKLSAFDAFTLLDTEIEFVNLQFENSLMDGAMLPLRDVMENGFDWMDTAAIVAQLDLIISVDTGVVHLAAAMGKPTWLLSRFNPCWRWLRNQPTNPWYPDVLRVFGQTQYGDWTVTLEHVRQELRVWLTMLDKHIMQ